MKRLKEVEERRPRWPTLRRRRRKSLPLCRRRVDVRSIDSNDVSFRLQWSRVRRWKLEVEEERVGERLQEDEGWSTHHDGAFATRVRSAARSRRETKEMLRRCREVMTLTKKHKFHKIFLYPVDPVVKAFPITREIVKNRWI